MDYKEIAKQTGLKINHVKQVLKGKRKATIQDMISIGLALKTTKYNSFEEYHKEMVDLGYITKSGAPIKCECGNKDFKKVDCYYQEGIGEVEYSLECTNEECEKIVGNWSYGNWNI